MEQAITRIYQQKDKNKKELFKIKNKCFAIIYGMVLNGENIRKIHKKIWETTLKMPKLFLFMQKVANKSAKNINKNKTKEENADLLLLLFTSNQYNNKAKKLINHEIMEDAENQKSKAIKNYIKESRDTNKWFYMASSHTDSAKDHLPYQGKLYYDDKAPEEIIKWAYRKGLYSIQWVMGAPVWFITRPNCRHFFKSLDFDIVKKYSQKEITRRYKLHRKDGDKSLATPRGVTVEEYEDRLKMLKAMNKEHTTERLRREIQKVELLIKKWKNML